MRVLFCQRHKSRNHGKFKGQKKLSDQVKLIEEKLQDCQNLQDTPEKQSQIENLLQLRNELRKSLNALNRKSNILWPYSTMYSQHRSRNSILEIVEKIENNERLSIDESKGIVGRSLLLDIPDFNFTYDVPAEYLHSGCLGVIKKLVELTFNVVSKKKKRNTKRKLSSPAKFNRLMSLTKVPGEFPRRARNLDFSVFKGQEFRNMSIFYFPLVLECVEKGAEERHLWLYLAYMLRATLLPSDEFVNVDLNIVRECCDKFYKLYEELFSCQNCTYNIHIFLSHLLEIRTHGPLTETSAFKFESFYGEIRRSFVPGTTSTLKQIFKTVMLKRTLKKHYCKNDMIVSNYDTPMECNSLVYTHVRNEYKIYKISEIDGDTVTCHKLGQYPASFEEIPNLNWSAVSVFRRGGESSTSTTLNASMIAGKVLHVDKYLITCPHNVLNEK